MNVDDKCLGFLQSFVTALISITGSLLVFSHWIDLVEWNQKIRHRPRSPVTKRTIGVCLPNLFLWYCCWFMNDNQHSVIIWWGEGVVSPGLLTMWVIVSLNCILWATATFPTSYLSARCQLKSITCLETGLEECWRGISLWFLSTWLMKILNFISNVLFKFSVYMSSSLPFYCHFSRF